MKILGHRVIKHSDLGAQLVRRGQRNSKPSVLSALCMLVTTTMRPINEEFREARSHTENMWKLEQDELVT